ncbi:MAG: hypothetical protein F6K04_18195 [Leptolyngbya sp. SIO4C5]|nr:hypothetical protein [Leptolyngbya sp. SIO4C5]
MPFPLPYNSAERPLPLLREPDSLGIDVQSSQPHHPEKKRLAAHWSVVDGNLVCQWQLQKSA